MSIILQKILQLKTKLLTAYQSQTISEFSFLLTLRLLIKYNYRIQNSGEWKVLFLLIDFTLDHSIRLKNNFLVNSFLKCTLVLHKYNNLIKIFHTPIIWYFNMQDITNYGSQWVRLKNLIIFRLHIWWTSIPHSSRNKL